MEKIHILNQIPQADRKDIQELILAADALVKTRHQAQVKTFLSEIILHSFAIYDGIYAVSLLYQHNKKLALFYIFLFLIFAKYGFNMNKQKEIAQQRSQESKEQYKLLGQILNSPDTTQTTIHDITTIYREHVPTFDNVTPESVQAALQQIIRQYQK